MRRRETYKANALYFGASWSPCERNRKRRQHKRTDLLAVFLHVEAPKRGLMVENCIFVKVLGVFMVVNYSQTANQGLRT